MRLLLTISSCLLLPSLVGAQSLQNLILRNSFSPSGAGARGAGMGGAFIAVADDGTAASFNPAGLAQLRHTELALVNFEQRLTSTIEGRELVLLDPLETQQRQDMPEFVGLAVPFEMGSRRLTVQLSYHRAVDLFGKGRATVFMPLDLGLPSTGSDPIARDALSIELDSEQSGALHTASLAAGLQLTDRVSLGTSVNYWIGEWGADGTERGDLNLTSGLLGPSGRYPLFQDEFSNQQTLRGLNANIGLLLRYPKLSFGAVYRTAFAGSYDLSEEGTSTDLAVDGPAQAEPWALRSTSRLFWPRSAGVGLALRPFSWLTLAGDYSHVEWSRTILENVPNGALLTEPFEDADGNRLQHVFMDRNFFDLFPASQTLTKNASQWRVGSEVLLVFSRFVVPLRFGAFWDRSPVPDASLFQGRRIGGATFGTGLNFNRFVLDVTFERRTSHGAVGLVLDQQHSWGAPQDTGLFPDESVTQHRVVGSLIVRLGGDGDDFVKRLLRRLFGSGDE